MGKRLTRLTATLTTGVFLTACGGEPSPAERAATLARANELATSMLIVDTHIDVPYRIEEEYEDVSEATDKGDFDYPRARNGGLNVPFMSIYIPAAREAAGTAGLVADKLIGMMEDLVAGSPDKFALARTTSDVEEHFDKGLISIALGMENGAPIAGDLANLDKYYDRGMRSITLTHSLSNHISDSSYDIRRQWGGLSPFGMELVPAMNDRGMMVDVSHISDEAFYDVMEVTRVPVIASHSSARFFTPKFERNMDDDMIRALARNCGVIQSNFGSGFVRNASRLSYDQLKRARDLYLEENGFESDGPEADEFTRRYREETPYVFADISDVLDHIDHVRDLVGVEHIGIGSDYDGVGDSLPTFLKDVSTYPNLIAGLLERGYSEDDIRQIMGGNLMRVWRQVEEYAERARAAQAAAG